MKRVVCLALAVAACDRPSAEVVSPWPLKADGAVLSCSAGRVFVTLPGGKKYAVNGSAMKDAPDVAEVTSYYDTTALIPRGLKLCDQGPAAIEIRPEAKKADAAPAAGRTFVEANDDFVGGVRLVTSESTPIEGQRPEIYASCDDDGTPSLHLSLVHAPDRPPPLHGVFADFRFGGWPKQHVEMSWFDKGSWVPREKDADRKLVRAMLKADHVSVTMPDAYAAKREFEWDIHASPADVRRMRKACTK